MHNAIKHLVCAILLEKNKTQVYYTNLYEKLSIVFLFSKVSVHL